MWYSQTLPARLERILDGVGDAIHRGAAHSVRTGDEGRAIADGHDEGHLVARRSGGILDQRGDVAVDRRVGRVAVKGELKQVPDPALDGVGDRGGALEVEGVGKRRGWQSSALLKNRAGSIGRAVGSGFWPRIRTLAGTMNGE